MTVNDGLFELGCEELPARALSNLSEVLKSQIAAGLRAEELNFDAIHTFATPRRLAVIITQLTEAQPDQFVARRGPSLDAAYDQQHQPTPAALGFAKSCGVPMNELHTVKTDKGEWLSYSQKKVGQSTIILLPIILQKVLERLSIAKSMRWGNHKTPFLRPVRWVVLLYGSQWIGAKFFDQMSGKISYGHRFHHPHPIEINTATEYENKLMHTGFVIPNFDSRKKNIENQIRSLALAHQAKPVLNDALLDEVTGLVEWPQALLGTFHSRFLEIPREVLITSMQNHQKCFALESEDGHLLPHFVAVANIKSKHPDHVTTGNERVICARLSDAEFFYRSDLKVALEDRVKSLKNIVFHQHLGTLLQKVERLSRLASVIAMQTGANTQQSERAGYLCKADLVTGMVGEFPELQGIMGYYYAVAQGESVEVAEGIREHYRPRFSGDELPKTPVGIAISIADKLDTLAGCFAIHEIPTGDKDPLALRRQALGILRILIERSLPLNLTELIRTASSVFSPVAKNQNSQESLEKFFLERLRAYYLDQGFSAESFNAVAARHPDQPLDFHRRLLALQVFCGLSGADALAAAHKRVSGILQKECVLDEHLVISNNLLKENAEIELSKNLEIAQKTVQPLFAVNDYVPALQYLATLAPVVDNFFDKVMVNVPEAPLRKNRLAILKTLRELFLKVADISLLPKA